MRLDVPPFEDRGDTLNSPEASCLPKNKKLFCYFPKKKSCRRRLEDTAIDKVDKAAANPGESVVEDRFGDTRVLDAFRLSSRCSRCTKDLPTFA